MAQKFIDNVNKKQLDMNFKNVLGKKIITDSQIEDINNKLSLKDFEIDNLKLKVSELITGIEKANLDKEKFMKNNLSKKYVTQEILITELSKELDKVKDELQNIKDTPNFELIAANEKIKKLELAAQKKKELEDLKAKEYADKKLDRIKQKEFQDSKNLRLEKFDRQLSNRINEDAYELFYEQFGDIKKGSVVKADVFEDFVFKVIEHLKEKYKEFSELLNYKNFQGEEINMIEEEVGYAEDDYKEKTHSKQR